MSKSWLAALCVAIAASATGADDEWREVVSEHFVVYSDASEKDARRVAKELETIRQVYEIAVRGVRGRPTPKLQVLAARNRETLEELIPRSPGDDRRLAAGVFFRRPDQSWIVLDQSARGEERYSVVYHEYFHSLAMAATPTAPLWFHEGLAGMWENTNVKKETVETAWPSRIHLAILQNERPMPLEELVAVDTTSPAYREQHRASIFYAQSWALAHYIFLGDETKELLKGVGPYLEAIDSGRDSSQAFEDAFGEFEELEKQLRGYIRQFQFKALRLQRPPEINDQTFSVRVLEPSQSHALLASYYAQLGLAEQARARVEDALALNPRDSLALESQGLVQLAGGDRDAAIASFEQALKANSARYLARYYVTVLAAADAGQAQLPALIPGLERVLELNPFHYPSLSRLAIALASTGGDATEALGLARRSLVLAPDDPLAHTALGLSHLSLHERERAIQALERAVALDPELEFAKRHLERARETEEP